MNTVSSLKDDTSPEHKLWQEFTGKQNTDDTLIAKAKAIAPFVIRIAADDTQSLFKWLHEKEDRQIPKKEGEIFLEMILFYLHIINRAAAGDLGAEQRKTFLDTLFVDLRESLARVHEDRVDPADFRTDFAEAYNGRQNEYARYNNMFNEGEGLAGTLFWEFGKKIAGALGSENDAIIIMYTVTMAHAALTVLKLPELFKE